MIIQCRCESCGAKIRVDEKHLGRWAKCPRCSCTFEVLPPGESSAGSSSRTALEPRESPSGPPAGGSSAAQSAPRTSAAAPDPVSDSFPAIVTGEHAVRHSRSRLVKSRRRRTRSTQVFVVGALIAGFVVLAAVFAFFANSRHQVSTSGDVSSRAGERLESSPSKRGADGTVFDDDGLSTGSPIGPVRSPSDDSTITGSSSTGNGGWLQDFEAAKRRAFVEEKDVLVAFVGSDWSTLSQSLTREVFLNEQFLRFCGPRYVLVQVDLPRGESARQALSDPGQTEYLVRHFRPRDLPSTVLTDAYGRPYARLEGYDAAGPASFVARLEQAEADRQRWRELMAAIAESSSGDRIAPAVEAVGWLKHRRLLRYYEPELQRLFALVQESGPRDGGGQLEIVFSASWLSQMINADDSGHLAAVRKLADDLDRWSRQHPFRDPNRAGELYLTAATALAKCDLRDRAQDYIDRALAAGPNSPELLDQLKRFSRNVRRILSSGSGFFVTSAGHILTNVHVVDGPGEVAVRVPGTEEQVAARVVARDAARDMALLYVELPDAKETIKPLALSTAEVNRGSPVAVFGFPLGDAAGSGLKLTTGVISGLPDSSPEKMLLLDCRVNPGNSGGPLCNQYGQVIGMVSKKSRGEANVDSYGMALPAVELLEFLRQHIPDYETVAVAADNRMQWDEVDRLVSPAVLMILKVE